ncbi:hypothetical protein Pedsa_2179 [Pseudopedobacter saltans DSM 12145]|uniref:DUF4403 domain-containing protein n=1 Tax=Pseudopedobacter saltans (strain ATCC 51119 / DSM 12145 / JCM 21818 / CCUG 39354 / LMG 10337 / NBRC 100064 / NCIMB 13643) TaxID=762903 RepID=F0SBP0_PSESL|nr:DUF4403 family protein [Pseudopedobacter saltans]ADY52731.1 hypothetical protein Pedsa_2179 [Pseudopedobacter saltans DSM 12145]
MHKRISSLLVISGILLNACSTSKKIEAIKPLADYSSDKVIYDKQLSYINIPLEIGVAEIQSQTNKYLNGILYEDKNINDDNIAVKVTKEAPITIREQGGNLYIDLPLRVNGKVRYGFEKLGLSMYDTRDFYMNGTISLISAVGFKDWKLNTRTVISDIKWKESPSVQIAGKNMPVTYLINPAITVFKSIVAKKVDDAIAETLDIKPYVLEALDKLAEPFQVNQEYNTWFSVQAQELYSTRAVVANKKVKVGLGAKTYFETVVGQKPEKVSVKNIPLKSVDKIQDQFKANVAAYVTYRYAAGEIQKNLSGQKFESGKKYVSITKIDLWGKEGKMIVAADMIGSVNGTFYLVGVPVYDAVKKEVILDQVDFILDSKSKLLRTADWLAHGMIVKKIAENCRFSIANQLSDGEKAMKGYLNNYQPAKGIIVNGTLGTLSPDKIILTPNAIVAMVTANGKVNIKIEGMD